jgi:hypothetical protein
MIALNDLMMKKFEGTLFNRDISINKYDKFISPYSFVIENKGIFIGCNQNKILQEKDLNDIPFWEFHVNRFDSDAIGLSEHDPHEIMLIVLQIGKNIVKNFKIQFPNKKIRALSRTIVGITL